MAYRYDSRPLSKATKLDNGWLRAPANLTRVGVFEYMLRDGSIRRELRLPEEVFAQDSLDSFELVPLVDDHPREGELTANNTGRYTVGAVGKVRRDGDFVAAEVLVQDGKAVERIEAGKQELSCGYHCDVENTPGEWNGQRYDGIQRKIRGNHVALVTKGRAGPEARVRLDNADDAVLVSTTAQATSVAQEKIPMIKFKIDGIDVEVSDVAATLIGKERAAAQATIAAATSELEKAKGRADAAEAKVVDLQKKLDAAEDPKRFDAAVAARVALQEQARKVLGAEEKLDGLSDDDIRRKVILKIDSAAQLDGKSTDYLQARFDAALSVGGTKSPAALEMEDRLKNKGRNDSAPTDPVRALNAAIANAHKQGA